MKKSAKIIPLFPPKPIGKQNWLFLSKRQRDYLSFLITTKKDQNGWIRMTQKEVYNEIGMRPETQKKYRELFSEMGLIEIFTVPGSSTFLIRLRNNCQSNDLKLGNFDLKTGI